jgi:hypothetical protein
VFALVEEAERAYLAGDAATAFARAGEAVEAVLPPEASENDRRAAFEAATRLAVWAQPAAPVAALEAAAEEEGPSRPWALRALGAAYAFDGRLADARTTTDALTLGYEGSEHALYGLALRVRVEVEAGDEAGALSALSALVSAFPDSEEGVLLAVLVQSAFPEANVTGALAQGRAAQAAAAAPTASAVGAAESVALLTLGAVRPNPALADASLPFALSGAAEVEAVLYDALGRRVAVLARGSFGAGHHVVAVHGAALPAGVYVVYVTAHPATGGQVTSAVGRLTLTD